MGVYSDPETCNYGPCDVAQTRRYLNGWFCTDHTPARLAGREDIVPPKYDLKPLLRQPYQGDYRALIRQKRRDRIDAKRAKRT